MRMLVRKRLTARRNCRNLRKKVLIHAHDIHANVSERVCESFHCCIAGRRSGGDKGQKSTNIDDTKPQRLDFGDKDSKSGGSECSTSRVHAFFTFSALVHNFSLQKSARPNRKETMILEKSLFTARVVSFPLFQTRCSLRLKVKC